MVAKVWMDQIICMFYYCLLCFKSIYIDVDERVRQNTQLSEDEGSISTWNISKHWLFLHCLPHCNSSYALKKWKEDVYIFNGDIN